MFKLFPLVALACALTLFSNFSYADIEDVSAAGYELIAKKRLDSVFFEYTFAVSIENTGGPLNNVMGALTSSSRTTIIMDSELMLGTLESGTTLSTDTIKFRQDRRVVFKPSSLFWSFTGDQPPTNTTPVAVAGADQSANIGDTITLNGSGSFDADLDPLTYNWTLTHPAGSSATLSDANTVLTQFTADVQGQYTATLIVNDGQEDSTADSVTVTVTFQGDTRPVITSTPVTTGSVNTSYSYEVDATDADAGDVLTYSLLTQPSGMTIDENTGLINWTANATGPADVDVQVSDSTGLTDRQIFVVLVNAGSNDQPPTLQPIANQISVVGNTLMVTAVGSDSENDILRYSLLVSPDGMGINSASGELQWTPNTSQIGTASATVSVQDPGGQSAQQSFSVEVNSEAVNARPDLAPIANQQVNAQDTVSVMLMATDADANDILTFSLTGTPAGAQFDAPASILNWVPTSSDAGLYNLIATVTDSVGATDSKAFSITVLEPPLPAAAPVAVNDRYAIRRGGILNVAAPGVLTNDTDANGDVLSAAKTSDPAVGTLNQFGTDGSFTYATPTPAPIDIGIAVNCKSTGNLAGYGPPLVADLDGDGKAEILMRADNGFSTLRVQIRDGATCELIAETQPGFVPEYGLIHIVGSMAVGDIDGDGDLEILVPLLSDETGSNDQTHFVAFDHELNFLWKSETVANINPGNSSDLWARISGLVIADIDADGTPELLLGYPVVSGPDRRVLMVAFNNTGNIIWETLGSFVEDFNALPGTHPVQVADLDLDGTQELLYHTDVFSHTGELEFKWPIDPVSSGDPIMLVTAVANFDSDPYPEVVGLDHSKLTLFNHDGSVLWSRSIVGENHTDGYLLTVADIDGDGIPEIVFPGAKATDNSARRSLRAYESDGSIRWTSTDSRANSLQTLVHAFDFDSDGSDELVYLSREAGVVNTYISIVNGFDGVEIARRLVAARASAPTQPFDDIAIADVDNDGAAEIVTTGIFDLQPGHENRETLEIYEGLPGNPWAPARPIYNHWGYQPNLVNSDGTIPQSPTPHWLTPGLNGTNIRAVVPGEPGAGDQDQFTYVASDDTADSNEATVSITIAPNVNPPLIVSTPPLGASPDFEYEYGLLSTDADPGDVLTYTLVNAPTGMSVNNFGVLTWTPPTDATGTVSVYLVVTDSQNNTDSQQWDIDILPPVAVPDLSGLDALMADSELMNSGLVLGGVTQSYSLTVPQGEVISQSIGAGDSSAPGAIVNIVISLGPQPVFIPTLVGLEQNAASTNLNNVGLTTGTVTLQNSDVVTKGVVISQSPLPSTTSTPGASVNLIVSSGPAVRVNLQQTALGPNDSTTLELSFFDNLGNPTTAPADLSVEIESGQGALGTLPQLNGSDLIMGGDTEGAYSVKVTAPSIGLDKRDEFVVFVQFGSGRVQHPYALMSGSINRLESLYAQLTEAANSSDTTALQTLAMQLVVERDAIDLEALRRTPPIAPAVGFLPNGTVGIASTIDLESFPILLRIVRQKLLAKQSFLEQLQPGGGRDDDIRAVVLNQQMQAAADILFSAEPTINGYLLHRNLLHDILSNIIPQLMVTQIDVALEALGNANVIALHNGTWQADQTRLLLTARTTGRTSPRSLKTKNADAQRQLFFTLGGLMSASQIQSAIIEDVYSPVIKRVVTQATLLVLDGLIREFMNVTDLTGVMTMSSLSFHFFEASNSIIEIPGGPLGAGSYLVTFIGPDLPQGIADALEVVNDGIDNPPIDSDGAQQLYDSFEDAISGALNGVQHPDADQDLRGCFLSSDPDCHQLVFNDGFPVVFTLGDGFGAGLPAPVLIYVYDVVNQSIYASTQAFYPTPATPNPNGVHEDKMTPKIPQAIIQRR